MLNYFKTIWRRIQLLKAVKRGILYRKEIQRKPEVLNPVKPIADTKPDFRNDFFRKIKLLIKIRRAIKNRKKLSSKKKNKQSPFSNTYIIYRRVRFLTYRIRQSFIKGHVSENIPKPGIPLPDRWIILFNSTAYFILAFIFIQIVTQLLQYIVAAQFDYGVLLKPWGIYYNITSDRWTIDSVKTLYSIKPVSSLIIGIVMLIISGNLKELEGSAKLFVIWLAVHGLSGFFGAVFFGTLMTRGFGHVLVYMYLSDTARMVFVILAGGVLLAMGVIVRAHFLLSANIYYNKLPVRHTRQFINWNVFLPALLATLFIVLLRLPGAPTYEILLIASSAIMIMPVHYIILPPNGLDFGEEGRVLRLRKWAIAIAFIILIGHGIISRF